jgi:hypothetical protein
LLDIPGYDVAALVEKSGKSASHVYARLSLLQLIPTVAEAFTQERITASHANLIARLPQESQAEAFEQCWRKDWQDKEPHLLPAKHVAAWIQATFERIIEQAPASFNPAQMRVFLRLLIHLDHSFLEEVATHFANGDENTQQSDDEIVLVALDGTADEKLTGLALRLVLSDHIGISHESQPDLLTEAEQVFAPKEPKAIKAVAPASVVVCRHEIYSTWPLLREPGSGSLHRAWPGRQLHRLLLLGWLTASDSHDGVLSRSRTCGRIRCPRADFAHGRTSSRRCGRTGPKDRR